MTTTVQLTLHKHPDTVVRVSLVRVADGEVLCHHDVIAGHCQESCEFSVFEGVRLFIEEREPERAPPPPPAPPPAPPSEEKPAVTADAPQPDTVAGQPPAEGQQPAAVAEQSALPVQSPAAQDAPAAAAPTAQPASAPAPAASPAAADKRSAKAKTGAKGK